ncbi:hypothetical protein ACGFX2_32765 [Streptomyces goshikiensis]|uniref:hypothetical protein n=1 Tax=Streptomyces goshikiensis TaxID=1942 RepID=UPI003722FE9A
MDEGERVEHLQCCRSPDDRLAVTACAAGMPAGHAQHGPHPPAAAQDEVTEHLSGFGGEALLRGGLRLAVEEGGQHDVYLAADAGQVYRFVHES